MKIKQNHTHTARKIPVIRLSTGTENIELYTPSATSGVHFIIVKIMCSTSNLVNINLNVLNYCSNKKLMNHNSPILMSLLDALLIAFEHS